MSDIQPLADHLQRQLGEGRVFGPGDDGHHAALQVWNAAVTAQPALVVRPRDAAQTATVVATAAEHGVGVSVRGGGHDVHGRALRDGGLVIDLGDLRDVRVDRDRAVVGGGALAADVVAAAGPEGWNVVTGTAGLAGMAGLTLGGGYGPLLGTAGLAADNLLAAEVVLADGRIVRTEAEPDLLWALRGGGGNFGVVTEMTIQLHHDRGLTAGMVLFGGAEARQVLTRYHDLLADPDDGLTLLIELTVAPQVGPCVMVVPVWSGDPGRAESALDAVRRLGDRLTWAVAPTTQQAMLQQFDQQVPHGMHWDIRTRLLGELNPAVVDLLVDAVERRPGPGAGIGLRQFHGAATRVAADDSVFGRRTSHVAVEISAGRGPDDDPTPFTAWADQVSEALAAHALPGGYPNFLGADRTEQIAHAYGDNRDRLLRTKQRYDPTGMFTATPLPLSLLQDPAQIGAQP